MSLPRILVRKDAFFRRNQYFQLLGFEHLKKSNRECLVSWVSEKVWFELYVRVMQIIASRLEFSSTCFFFAVRLLLIEWKYVETNLLLLTAKPSDWSNQFNEEIHLHLVWPTANQRRQQLKDEYLFSRKFLGSISFIASFINFGLLQQCIIH